MQQNSTLYSSREDFEQRLNENYSDIKVMNTDGGGGVIYSAIHRRLGEKVVLKKIRTAGLSLIGKEREIQILLSLKHTYLPRIYDFWSYGNDVYTVMEFIEGRSLQDLIKSGRTFKEREVFKLTRQLAEVMVYLHGSSLKLVHSDIKPANIMLTPEGNICLIDFNISILGDSEPEDVIGYSAGYSPIEQLIMYELGNRRRKEKKAAPVVSKIPSAPTQPLPPDDGHTTIGLSAEATTLAFDPDATTLGTQLGDKTSIGGFGEGTTIGEGTSIGAPSPSAAPVTIEEPKSELSITVDKLIKKYGTKMHVDERSDVYAACATMYKLLTGQTPKPCYEPQIPVLKLVPNASETFARILDHGLKIEPSKRYKSSEQFLKALAGHVKSNRKFKMMRLRQDIVVILLTAITAAGAVAGYTGLKLKFANRAESLVESASQLYLAGDYEGSVGKVNELLANPLFAEEQSLADAYYLVGCCQLQTENYTAACDSFRTAVVAGAARPEYYRDYGIALVETGDVKMAEECLAQARALGLADDSLLLLDGEIRAANGESELAHELLTECLESDAETMIRVRAAAALDDLEAKSELNEANYKARIDRLESALTSLEGEGILRLPLEERLAQALMDVASLTGKSDYTLRAIEVLDAIIDDGYATIVEVISKADCLQSLDRYSEARDVLFKATEKYPSSYLIYKKLAFNEIEWQYAREIDERNYVNFKTYYEACMELYAKEPHGTQDLELQVLEKTYAEAVDKGWLAK